MKRWLTGCTALTIVMGVGLAGGSARADVSVTTGTTVSSSTITSGSGTINLGGGTLAISSNSILSNAIMAATGSSSTIAAVNHTSTLSGALSGTGNLSLTGTGGTVVLSNTANSAYTGVVTVNSGATLQMGSNNVSLLGSPQIVDNGTVTVSISGGSSTTNIYAGAISGTGNFNKVGNGALYLTGNNTYTGATAVSGGATLYIGNGNIGGSIASSSVSVASGSSLYFNTADKLVYNGTITGAGSVRQYGPGTLVLNGPVTLTGAAGTTNVGPLVAYTGTMLIGDAAHPSATATAAVVNVLSGANLGGFGKIVGNVINGDDAQTSSTQLVGGILMPGDGSNPGTLTVNGNYTQGRYGSLLITANPDKVSLLTITGAAHLAGQLSVSPKKGDYAVGLYPIIRAGSLAGTFSRVTIGDAAADTTFGIYYAPSNKEIDLVVAPKTIGQVYSDLVIQNLDAANSLNELVLNRTAFGTGAGREGFSVWAHGFTSTDGIDAGNGASAFSNHGLGVIGGLDYRFASGLSFHATTAISNGNMALHDSSATASNQQVYLAATAHVPAGPVAFDGSYFYLNATSDVSRKDGLGNTVTSKIDNGVNGMSLQVSAPFLQGDLVPFGRITYAVLVSGPTAETGSSSMLLSVDHGHQTTGRYALGLRVGHSFVYGDGISIRPQLLLAGESNDRTIGKTNPMTMLNGEVFYAPAPSPDRLAVLAQAGLGIDTGNMNFQIGVQGRESANQEQLLFNFGAAYHF